MNNDTGYVYLLVNPSLEGLIKVGQTTRDTKARAIELSKSSGASAPFVVGYEMFVDNCSKAEEFVHAWLIEKGYKLDDKKELFNAPVTEAIAAVLAYKKIDSAAAANQAEFSDRERDADQEKLIWDLLREAAAYEAGAEGQNPDDEKAYALYKQAAELGSCQASGQLGKMHRHGKGCTKDNQASLDYFKQAASYGDNTACGQMMECYFVAGDFDNAVKCWDRYADYIKNDPSAGFVCVVYIMHSYNNELPIKNVTSMLPIKNEIMQIQNRIVGKDKNKDSLANTMLTYMEYVLSFKSDEGIMTQEDYTTIYMKEQSKKANRRQFMMMNAMAVLLGLFLLVYANLSQ